MTDLRAACIHGRYDSHDDANDDGSGWIGCPGGREVTIDYEAAEAELLQTVFMLDKGDARANPVDTSRAIVNAAIGDTG